MSRSHILIRCYEIRHLQYNSCHTFPLIYNIFLQTIIKLTAVIR